MKEQINSNPKNENVVNGEVATEEVSEKVKQYEILVADSGISGKICPFCKSPIKESEEVIVCPSCDAPHHKGCWEENKGCTTFGCSEQHYEEKGTNPSAACSRCGALLGDGQAFCPKCGAPKGGEKKSVCSKCGTELKEGQDFCAKCGQKVGVVVDNAVSSAINQFNANVEKKKKKPKVLAIIIAAVLVVCVGMGAVIYSIINNKKAEEAKKEYIATVEEFLELSGTAGANLEDIADTVQTYWHENIWEDMHGDDINDAIMYALYDKSDEVNDAETYDTRIEVLYSSIKKVPDGVSEEDADDIKEICDAVKDLYNVYTDFYSLATNPSGSYSSYSDDNAETTDEFVSCLRALDNLLD